MIPTTHLITRPLKDWFAFNVVKRRLHSVPALALRITHNTIHSYLWDPIYDDFQTCCHKCNFYFMDIMNNNINSIYDYCTDSGLSKTLPIWKQGNTIEHRLLTWDEYQSEMLNYIKHFVSLGIIEIERNNASMVFNKIYEIFVTPIPYRGENDDIVYELSKLFSKLKPKISWLWKASVIQYQKKLKELDINANYRDGDVDGPSGTCLCRRVHPHLYNELQFNCKDMCSPFKYNPDVISIDGKYDEDDLYEITKYCDNEYLVRDFINFRAYFKQYFVDDSVVAKLDRQFVLWFLSELADGEGWYL